MSELDRDRGRVVTGRHRFEIGDIVEYSDIANPGTTYRVVAVNDNPWSTYDLVNVDTGDRESSDCRQRCWRLVSTTRVTRLDWEDYSRDERLPVGAPEFDDPGRCSNCGERIGAWLHTVETEYNGEVERPWCEPLVIVDGVLFCEDCDPTVLAERGEL